MKKRVLAACVFVPVMILLLSFTPSWAAMLLVSAMCGIGAHELMHAVAGERGKRLTPLTVAVALLIPLDIYWTTALSSPSSDSGLNTVLKFNQLMQGTDNQSYPSFLPWIALIFVFILFLYAILHYGKETAIPFSSLTAAIFAGVGFPLMLSCLLRLRLMEYGEILVWVPLAVCFGSDTCALFAGMAFGKHKMAPLVSPHKTVEGGVGGLAGGVVGLLILRLVVRLLVGVVFLNWTQLLIFGIVGAAVDEIGDLSFSVIKREYGVKDYGKLIPGHGGILDRFDSVTFVAPLVWLLCCIL